MDFNGDQPGKICDEEESVVGTREIVKVNELAEYIKNLTTGKIVEQYNSLKFGPSKSWEIGKRPENRTKNRYTDLLPYDDTRVVLKNRGNENPNFSDYINANYIDGYKKPKGYISTQGPLERTIADFWYMIWQEGTSKIIMAANIIEDCKKKCEKYWPDTTATYGDITISLHSERCYVDYTVRNFLLRYREEPSRSVRQYHFTAWPDHGVPIYPLSLVMMLKSVRKYQPLSKAPIVLHCSAGVGRSGTVMLLDTLIDMAEMEGSIDIVNTLAKMRQHRANLVETVEQYAFVYRALTDYFCGDVPQMSCENFQNYYNQLKQNGLLKEQFEKLSDLYTSGISLSKMANTLTREICYPLNTENTQKLNFLYIHGYGKRNSHVIVQYPKSERIRDFWQLIHDTESSVIVVLGKFDNQKIESPSYWPESGTLHQGNLRVDYDTSELNCGILVHTFTLHNSSEPQHSRTIKQYHLLDWKENGANPNPNSLISLLNKLDALVKGKPIIIVYSNSPSSAGLFCASWILYSQITEDRQTDIFSAVRTVRQSNQNLINNLEEYRCLYDVASAIVNEFTSRL